METDTEDVDIAEAPVAADANTKIFRVRAQVLRDIPGTRFEFQNPVPVFSGLRLIGAALLEVVETSVFAELMLDYETPERLDIETRKTWLLPDRVECTRNYRRCECGLRNVEVRGSDVTSIGSLRLSNDPGDPLLPWIGYLPQC